jgi:hypothetical protein
MCPVVIGSSSYFAKSSCYAEEILIFKTTKALKAQVACEMNNKQQE